MLKIKEDVIQAIHDYLMTKPMIEVEGLVMALRQCERIVEKDAAQKIAHENHEIHLP